MSALHHAKTEQRGSSFSHKPHSQHDDSSYSASDDSDDDNLPLASKGCVSLTTRMAITRAAQQSRPRGNVQTSSRSRANKIPHDSKCSRPLPAIRKGGTSDKTKNKKKTNSKKRDKDGPPDGSGLGGATTPPVESKNNDLQQIHNNDPPSKRRSSRKKKDNAEVIGGNEIHAMDVGNGGDNANRKTTDNAEEVLKFILLCMGETVELMLWWTSWVVSTTKNLMVVMKVRPTITSLTTRLLWLLTRSLKQKSS